MPLIDFSDERRKSLMPIEKPLLQTKVNIFLIEHTLKMSSSLYLQIKSISKDSNPSIKRTLDALWALAKAAFLSLVLDELRIFLIFKSGSISPLLSFSLLHSIIVNRLWELGENSLFVWEFGFNLNPKISMVPFRDSTWTLPWIATVCQYNNRGDH